MLAAYEMSPAQKAAIIVRVLAGEDMDLSLGTLPPEAQARLAHEMAMMGMVDRETRDQVVREFCDRLDEVGLFFPDSIDGTLDLLGDMLSQDTTDRLRRMAVLAGKSDPWERICALPPKDLAALAQSESVEVAAVMFSRLPVAKAAEAFNQMPADRARKVAYAMSLTSAIEAPALRRIGLALVQAADGLARPALHGGPVEKVGAILNFAPANTRDIVLEGLDEDDRDFATEVRKAIFTWANIPTRIDPRDLPRIIRETDQAVLIKALAGSVGNLEKTANFIFDNLSKRMADSLREEVAELPKISADDAEAAMAEIVSVIRRMEQEGDLFLIAGDVDSEPTLLPLGEDAAPE